MQDRMFLWRNPELLVENVIPDFLHATQFVTIPCSLKSATPCICILPWAGGHRNHRAERSPPQEPTFKDSSEADLEVQDGINAQMSKTLSQNGHGISLLHF